MNTTQAVNAFVNACAGGGRSPRTLKQYRWALRRLPAEVPTSADQIEAVLANENWNGTSKLAVYRVLHAFMGWACGRYGLPNPMRGVVRPKAERKMPEVFDPRQLRLIWASSVTPRERAMTRLLLDSGARVGEVANLRAGDLKGGTLRLDGKTGQRVGFISLGTARLMEDARRGGPAYFQGKKGPLTASGLYQMFKRILARAQITGRRLGPHTMRHTMATEFLRHKGDVFSLQRLLGHRSLRTTAIYVHLTASDAQAAHGSVGLAARLLDGAAV